MHVLLCRWEHLESSESAADAAEWAALAQAAAAARSHGAVMLMLAAHSCIATMLAPSLEQSQHVQTSRAGFYCALLNHAASKAIGKCAPGYCTFENPIKRLCAPAVGPVTTAATAPDLQYFSLSQTARAVGFNTPPRQAQCTSASQLNKLLLQHLKALAPEGSNLMSTTFLYQVCQRSGTPTRCPSTIQCCSCWLLASKQYPASSALLWTCWQACMSAAAAAHVSVTLYPFLFVLQTRDECKYVSYIAYMGTASLKQRLVNAADSDSLCAAVSR
jgi:hypothetical protein